MASARDHEQALLQAHKFAALDPEQSLAHMTLGLVHLGMRRYEDGAAALRKAADLSHEFPLILGWLGLALGLAGHRDEATALLDRLRAMARDRFVLPTSFAWTHFGLGQIDDNDEWIHPLRTYPFLDPVREDPRFAVLLERLSLSAA